MSSNPITWRDNLTCLRVTAHAEAHRHMMNRLRDAGLSHGHARQAVTLLVPQVLEFAAEGLVEAVYYRPAQAT